MSEIGKRVVAACEKHWQAHSANCSGFVKAVARELGIILTGQANEIVNSIQGSPWKKLTSGVEASVYAEDGLVIGGAKGIENGHVVVVVPGGLAHGAYPTGYWGRLRGIGAKNLTINHSFNREIRDKVIYGFYKL